MVRETKFDDYPHIVALEERCGLKGDSEEHWRHIWKDNPAYIHGWPLGWVIERSDGAIVGHLGNIPLRYELNGKALLTCAGRGWAVDWGYRHHSLTLLRCFLGQRVDVQLFTTMSATAGSLVERLGGAKRVPVGAWDRAAFWVTNYTGFASSLLAVKFPAIRTALRYPLAGALFMADCLGRKSSPAHSVDITICSGFDERFDEFWKRLKAQRRNVLLGVRTAEVLNWHFGYALRRGQVWIATAVLGQSVVAYFILMRQDNAALGLKRMRIVDFQALDGHRASFFPLLLWALQKCQAGGIHMLEQVGGTFGARLDGVRTHVRLLPAWGYFYRATDKPLAGVLDNPAAWSPTPFDGDATL